MQLDSGPGIDRFLIFATDRSLQIMQNSPIWYSGGTFSVVPTLFKQMYTLHCEISGTVKPMMYVLMSDKKQQNYIEILNWIKSRMCGKAPKSVVTDYELAAINAFGTVFPNTKSYGCFFHYAQCI